MIWDRQGLVYEGDLGQQARWNRPQVQAEEQWQARPPSRRARRSGGFLRAVIALLWLGVIGAGLYLGWRSGWLAAQLRPATVSVRGAEMCSAAEVLQQLAVNDETPLADYWLKAYSFKPAGNRWLSGVAMEPSLGRTAVLRAQERRPLALVKSGPLQGWLCDDGRVVPALAEDKGERFQRITALPPLLIPAGDLEVAQDGKQFVIQDLGQSDELMQVLAACALDLPGQVSAVKLGSDGSANLLCSDGLEVRLGELSNLPLKLAALPKALRLCADSRDKLRYLDASDSGIFYRKWKEAPAAATDVDKTATQ